MQLAQERIKAESRATWRSRARIFSRRFKAAAISTGGKEKNFQSKSNFSRYPDAAFHADLYQQCCAEKRKRARPSFG